jgi:hypothetical protein
MQKCEPAHSIRVHPCCTALRRAHRQRTLADGNPDCAGLLCSLSHRIAPARLAACSSTTARQRGPVAPPADSLVRLPTRFIFSLARLRLSCTDRACQCAQADRAQANHAQPVRAVADRADADRVPCRPRHADRAMPTGPNPFVLADRAHADRARADRAHADRAHADRARAAGARAAGARARANRSRAARCSCVRC